MNFYGHADKYANEPKTIVQELYKCSVAVVTRSTTKLFYSCFVVGCFIFVVTTATTKLLYIIVDLFCSSCNHGFRHGGGGVAWQSGRHLADRNETRVSESTMATRCCSCLRHSVV